MFSYTVPVPRTMLAVYRWTVKLYKEDFPLRYTVFHICLQPVNEIRTANVQQNM